MISKSAETHRLVSSTLNGYPFVSIVVLSYNSKKFLQACVESILQSCYPNFEVILVDNNSSDGSLELVKSIFGSDQRIRIVCNTENFGNAEGMNIGIRYARGDYIVISDSDVRMDDPLWLKKMVDAMLEDESIGIAAPAILSYGSEDLQSAGMGLLYPFCNVFTLHKGWSYDALLEKYPRPFQVFVAGGECFIIRKDILEQIGGLFDPTYFMYYEEIDLCWRIWLSGFRVVIVPTSAVRHFSGGSTNVNKNYPKVAYYYAKNNTRMILKNADKKHVFVLLTSSLLLALAGKLYILIRLRKTEGLQQYLHALWSNLKSLPEIMAQRKDIQNRVRRIDDDEYLWKVVGHIPVREMIRRHNLTATFRAQMKYKTTRKK